MPKFTFVCSSCSQPITTCTVFVRVQAPTVSLVKRFCSPYCLRLWCGNPSMPPASHSQQLFPARQ